MTSHWLAHSLHKVELEYWTKRLVVLINFMVNLCYLFFCFVLFFDLAITACITIRFLCLNRVLLSQTPLNWMSQSRWENNCKRIKEKYWKLNLNHIGIFASLTLYYDIINSPLFLHSMQWPLSTSDVTILYLSLKKDPWGKNANMAAVKRMFKGKNAYDKGHHTKVKYKSWSIAIGCYKGGGKSGCIH